MAKIELFGISAEVPESPHFDVDTVEPQEVFFTPDTDSPDDGSRPCWSLHEGAASSIVAVAADVARCFWRELADDYTANSQDDEAQRYYGNEEAWAEIARLARKAKG